MNNDCFYTMILDIEPNTPEIIKYIEDLCDLIEEDDSKMYIYITLAEEARIPHNAWNNHEEDLLWISKAFPNSVFTLTIQSWLIGDIWTKFFQVGKMYIDSPKVIYEKFDVAKLRKVDEVNEMVLSNRPRCE